VKKAASRDGAEVHSDLLRIFTTPKGRRSCLQTRRTSRQRRGSEVYHPIITCRLPHTLSGAGTPASSPRTLCLSTSESSQTSECHNRSAHAARNIGLIVDMNHDGGQRAPPEDSQSPRSGDMPDRVENAEPNLIHPASTC
jgi:hypothetical protein